MNIEKIVKNGTTCAVVRSDEIVIADTQSVLELLMTAKYDLGTKNIVIDKNLFKEEFFILSSGLAGDILQKYINYGGGLLSMEIFLITQASPCITSSMRAIREPMCSLSQLKVKRLNAYADK